VLYIKKYNVVLYSLIRGGAGNKKVEYMNESNYKGN
jgi:hypothetical protein